MGKPACFRIIDRTQIRRPTSSDVIQAELVQVMLRRFPELYDSQSFLSRYAAVRDKLNQSGEAQQQASEVSQKICLNTRQGTAVFAGSLDRETVLELLQVR